MRQEARYNDIGPDYANSDSGLDNEQLKAVTNFLNTAPTGQVSPPQITVSQNNYGLPGVRFVRLSTSGSLTITGFTGARTERLIANVGANNLVISHQDVASIAENRVITHTAASITLNAAESVFLWYDLSSQRWRTVGLV